MLVPLDFTLQLCTVFWAEIYKFLSFATRHTSNFDLKKENGHQKFVYDSPLSYGGGLLVFRCICDHYHCQCTYMVTTIRAG